MHLRPAATTGSSAITVTFDISRDIDLAAVDVQNRVNTALGRLPNEVGETGVTITKASSGFRFWRRCLLGEQRIQQPVPEQLH